MGKIIILRGNSGSGKSTTAKALQRKLGRGTMLIAQDYVRREMIWVSDTPDNEAIDLLINLVAYGNQNCGFVILEGILYSDIYKKLFYKVKELFHHHIYAYYFDIPFQETMNRHQQKPNSTEYGEMEMKKWWREKDHIGMISETIIGMDLSLSETVNIICRDLMMDE